MRFSFILILWGLLSVCQAQTKWVKQGQEFERALLWSNAMDSYVTALQRNENNTPAIIGLTRVGQRMLDDSLAVFRMHALNGDRVTALRSYTGAIHIQEQLARFKVKLTIADPDRSDAIRLQKEEEQARKTAESTEKSTLYLEGENAYNARRYKMRRSREKLCARIELSCCADTNWPKLKCLCEAIGAKANGHWCSAHRNFENAQQLMPGFRDVSTLMQECLNEGGSSLLVMPINGDYTTDDLTDWMHSHILSRIISRSNPFLSIVDREQLDLLLAEHEFCMSGLVESACAVRAGQLKGAEYVMVINLKDLIEEDGDLNRWERNGYEWYTTTQDELAGYTNGPRGALPVYVKKETDHKDPVTYLEYEQVRNVSIRMDYKVIDVSTSAVVVSGTQIARAGDKMHYIEYSGRTRFLYAAATNGAIVSDRSEIRDLIDNKPKIRSMDALRTEVHDLIANSIARETIQKLTGHAVQPHRASPSFPTPALPAGSVPAPPGPGRR